MSHTAEKPEFGGARSLSAGVARLRIEHFVRALEPTYGLEHGWHPHLHCILLTDGELGPEDLGIKHIAFEVDDIQKSYEEAKAKGVVFTETRMRTDGSVGTVFFKDPSGIILQFIQRAPG